MLVMLLIFLLNIDCTNAGILGGEADFGYVNYARKLRTWSRIDNGKPVTSAEVDPNGWPLLDVKGCIFDDRPTYAWKPPIDDPQTRQADYSGLWRLTLLGSADISITGCKGVSLVNNTYDIHHNQQIAYLKFEKGKWPDVANLLVINFTNTKRNSSASKGSGFTNLRLIHEQYFGRPNQLFMDEWATLMTPYDHLRWMGATGTNSYSWNCGGNDAYHCSIIEWKDRVKPSYAFTDNQIVCKGCVGHMQVTWEEIILAHNELNKDVWINVPVTASGPYNKGIDTPTDPKLSYIYQLALLFKNGNEYTNSTGLKSNLKIYIEHSNEVWNYGFKQYGLNKAAAVYEVNTTKTQSNLVGDIGIEKKWSKCNYSIDLKNEECWTHRRHARRVYEIAKVFEQVFGHGSLLTRILPIYASWSINPDEYYNHTLQWLEKHYGPVKQYLFALSNTEYFGPDKSWAARYGKLSPSKIAGDLYKQAATNKTNITKTFAQLKELFEIKLATYEAGPGYDLGGQYKKACPELSNFILANRHPNMKNSLVYDVKDVCWANGVDIYHQFSIHGKCSRYGCWGATEFYSDAPTPSPKAQAILELVGKTSKQVYKEVASRIPALDSTVRSISSFSDFFV